MEKKMIIVTYGDPALHKSFPPKGKEKIVYLNKETQEIIESPNLLWVFIRDDEWPKGNPNSRKLNQNEEDFFLRIVGLFDTSATILVVLDASRKTAFLRYALIYLRSVDDEDQFDMPINSFDPKNSAKEDIFLFKEVEDESDINFPFVRYIKKDDGDTGRMNFKINNN